MNQSYYFHPFWPMMSPSHFFPLLPIATFENSLFAQPIETSDDSIRNRLVEKKIVEISRDHSDEERKAEDKRKSIKKTKEDKNFSYRYQDKDRNIYSNILKGFILKIREDFNFQSQCENLISIMKISLNFDGLIEFIDENFKKSKTYISPAYMKKIFDNNKNSEIGKFFRILLSKYLKECFTLVLLASQWIQKHSKLLQMKKARELYELLYGTDNFYGDGVNHMEESN